MPLKNLQPVILCVIGLACWLYAGATASLAETLTPEDAKDATAAASTFLTAVSRLDVRTAEQYFPTDPEQFFSPCVFDKLPTLGETFVRRNQAYVKWQGETKCDSVPTSGYVLLRKETWGSHQWKVRQVCFYPDMARLQKKRAMLTSESKADRQAKPVVTDLARSYLRHWLRGDAHAMRAMWYDWTKKDLRHDDPVNVKIISSRVGTNCFHETTVTLTVDISLPVLSLIKSRYLCTFVVLKERGQWKVRGSSIEFHK